MQVFIKGLSPDLASSKFLKTWLSILSKIFSYPSDIDNVYFGINLNLSQNLVWTKSQNSWEIVKHSYLNNLFANPSQEKYVNK